MDEIIELNTLKGIEFYYCSLHDRIEDESMSFPGVVAIKRISDANEDPLYC